VSTGPDLSPAQHARIRRHLALIPAYVGLAVGWFDLLSHLPFGPAPNLPRDFAGVAYIAGQIADAHDTQALYDLDRRVAMLAALLPGGPVVRYPPFYGPQVSVFFAPFARLQYPSALTLWMAISLAVYLVCAFVVWRACPRLRDGADAVVVLALADPTLYYTLSFGQISAIALAAVTGAFLALRADRPLLAGACIGSLVYKPSLGVAFGIVLAGSVVWDTLVLRRSATASRSIVDRRLLIGAAIGAAAQLAIGAAYWGAGILAGYARAQVRLIPEMRDEFYLHHVHSWRGFFEILGTPAPWVNAAYLAGAAVILTVSLRCWRSERPLGVRYAVLLIATVLVNPHGYVYDLVILMPAYLLLWDAFSDAKPIEGLLYFCYIAPWFAIVAVVAHVQLSVPALATLGLMATKAERLRNVARTVRR